MTAKCPVCGEPHVYVDYVSLKKMREPVSFLGRKIIHARPDILHFICNKCNTPFTINLRRGN